MKRTYIAAAALLLGTSALAFAPSAKDAPLAGATTWQEQDIASGNPDLDLAETPKAADAATTGVGGPLETAAADLAPRPASRNYPPCSPGPGDDNCIQLYEPGVRTALASWNQATGGLLQPGEALAAAETTGEATASAVGGPYEPVGEGSETAMAGDGLLDPAAGETAITEGEATQTADAGQYSGVGGPAVETGYPPCSPGPGDDRCIQLYEPGVTGEGN